MIAGFAALLLAVVPIHGLVLETLGGTSVIVRTDPVTATMPSQTRRYRLSSPIVLRAGTTIDALLDPRARVLRDVVPAAAFAPGLPDTGRIVPIQLGNRLPAALLIDQTGRTLELERAFLGRTLILSFVFTRCPDRTLCPAISGKFAYLSQHLDPSRFTLAEITLDPQYDSPAILSMYGAAYGARLPGWELLTGTGSTITRLLDQFDISSMRVSADNFLHSDRLFIISPSGRVAYVIENASWDPQGVIAQARSVSGLASNPFERFRLALVADAIALCGGSQFGGIALLELSLFTLLTIVAFAGMWAVARVLWGHR